MKLREKKDRLLVALYLRARVSSLSSYFRLREIADEIGLERGPGELLTIAYGMKDSGLVDGAFSFGTGNDEDGLNVSLSSYGVETAEDLLEEHPEYGLQPEATAVPASDRYVTPSDNQRTQIVGDLHVLRDAVSQSNEGSGADREIALSEIAVFEATVIAPRVSTELIERFTQRVLKWLAITFSAAVVGQIAERLADSLLRLVNAG